MSDKINDGGRAFPGGEVKDDRGDSHPMFTGMSLRDWFAGMALQGMVSCPNIQDAKNSQYATVAYGLADAMIQEREEGP